MQDALQRIAATTACHAAVKANDPLTYEKMVHILQELRATAYSTVCPHGRPVMLRLTRKQRERVPVPPGRAPRYVRPEGYPSVPADPVR